MWAELLAPFPPFVPEEWVHDMPYHITRAHEGRTAILCAIVVGLDVPREFGIRLPPNPLRSDTWINAEGQRVSSPRLGYKLQDPPTFKSFEDALKVANTYLGVG